MNEFFFSKCKISGNEANSPLQLSAKIAGFGSKLSKFSKQRLFFAKKVEMTSVPPWHKILFNSGQHSKH